VKNLISVLVLQRSAAGIILQCTCLINFHYWKASNFAFYFIIKENLFAHMHAELKRWCVQYCHRWWIIVTFCVSRRRRKIYCSHARLCVCVSVCLSAGACPHCFTEPDVTWGSGRGCPLVVPYWADLQSVHGLRCYRNITRTLVTSFRPSRDVTT